MAVTGGQSGAFASAKVLWATQPCVCTITPQTRTVLRSSALQIVPNVGTGVADLGGNIFQIEKLTGGTVYNADAVGTVALAGDFVLRAGVPSLGRWAAGFNIDPLTDSNFTSIDYALLYNAGWFVFESGVQIGSGVGGTFGWIWRQGTTLNYGVGADFTTAFSAPLRTVAGVSAPLYFDSSFHDDGTIVQVYIDSVLPPVAYTMTAASASFALSGSAAAFPLQRRLTAASGSYALTGTAANLKAGRLLIAATVGYSIAATAVTFRVSMPAASAAFALAGSAAALKAGRRLSAATVSYQLTGTAAALKRGLRLAASGGAYALSGTAASLAAARRLSAGSGAYALNGTAAALLRALKAVAAPGTYSLAGTSAILSVTGGATAYHLEAVSGAFALTPTAAALLMGQRLVAGIGSYALNGSTVAFTFYDGRATLIFPAFPPLAAAAFSPSPSPSVAAVTVRPSPPPGAFVQDNDPAPLLEWSA